MRLIGRRLPDVLIGVLIVILALGLGSLLLTQRNRAAVSEPNLPAASIPSAPGSEGDVASSSAPTAPVQAPQSPSVESPSVQDAPPAATSSAVTSAPVASATSPATSATTAPSSATSATTPPAASVPAPTQRAPATPADTSANQTPAPPEQPTTIAPAPQTSAAPSAPVTASTLQPPTAPQVDTSQPPVVTTPATQTKTDTQPSSSFAGTPSSNDVPAAPATAPRSGGAVATSENRTPLRRDYRISLGTFGSETEASSRTAGVKALGYTVYPIDLGDKVVAQIGPFADAKTASAALADVERTYSGAVLYAPRGVANPPSTPSVTSSSAPSTGDAASASTPAAPAVPSSSSTPAAQPKTDTPSARVSAPAPSGPVYLQVGAFDRSESAQNMVGMLRDLGYAASVQAPEGKKVTVLIGPFSGDAVVRAESKLNDNGFDHFRVR